MITAIVQARTGSTRLPGKVLKEVLGKSLLEHQITRLKRSTKLEKIVIATTQEPNDDPIVEIAKNAGIDFFRGSEEDTLDRYYKAATQSQSEIVVRITGDCPLIAPEIIDAVINFYLENSSKYDYVSNVRPPSFPDGMDIEVLPFAILEKTWKEAKLPSEREHVTAYIGKHPEIFRIGNYLNSTDLSKVRLTVDEAKDYQLVKEIFENLLPKKEDFSLADIMDLFEKKPMLYQINAGIIANEGYFKSLYKDKMKELSKVVGSMSEATSVRFNMRVYDLQKKGEDIIVLSLGEAFFNIPMQSFEAIAFEKGYHYSSSMGILELREKITNYYSKEYGTNFDAEKEILISAGSKIIIYMVLLLLLDPGDEVIVLEPAWVSYVEQIRLCYGTPVMIPHDESVFNLDKYINGKTKAIIINNPNNPSGKVYSKEELEKIFALAKENGIYILSDEAYSDFVIEEPFISMGAIDKDKELTFVINSLSKCFGISGWRIGYVMSNKVLIKQLLKLNQHLITCPTTLIELYLAKYFDDIHARVKPQVKDVVKKRSEVKKILDKHKLEYLNGSGTFYFLVSIKGSALNSEEFAMRLLDEYKISTVPGIGYGDSVDKFLRVSIGTESIERIERGITSIKKLISETNE